MTIEQMRTQYATLRDSLPTSARCEWQHIEQAFAELDLPPTPSEWVEELSKFSDEVAQYDSALGAWVNLRSTNPQGWGEDHDPNAEIKGWGDHLDLRTKANLLRLQRRLDLQTMVSYDEWIESRD